MAIHHARQISLAKLFIATSLMCLVSFAIHLLGPTALFSTLAIAFIVYAVRTTPRR